MLTGIMKVGFCIKTQLISSKYYGSTSRRSLPIMLRGSCVVGGGNSYHFNTAAP
jgi:hypothetical protein